MGEVDDGNVVYIDEYNRERWLLNLRVARATGEVAVFNAHRAERPDLANVLIFPDRPEPDGVA